MSVVFIASAEPTEVLKPANGALDFCGVDHVVIVAVGVEIGGRAEAKIGIYNMFPEDELENLLYLIQRLTDRISTIDDLGLLTQRTWRDCPSAHIQHFETHSRRGWGNPR